jgi:hypothetical protein
MNDNRYFVFLVPDLNPFYIRCYGRNKMIITFNKRKVQIIDSHGFDFTKSEILSEISHFFNLSYIKHYNKKCALLEINPEDYIEKE